MFDCDDYLSSGSDESLTSSPIYDRYQLGNEYHSFPPPYTGTFIPPNPDLVFNNAPNDDETDHPAFNVELSPTKPDNDLSHTYRLSAPIACFVCKSLDHLIKDYEYDGKKMAQPTTKNHAKRGTHKKYAQMTLPNPQSTWEIQFSNGFGLKEKLTILFLVQGNPQHALKDKKVIDSRCSRHMIGNMSYLSDFEELNGGYVSLGGNPKGGKIFRKDKTRTGKLDFDDVYFFKELKFNLFSVSQMCDKKNSVLFTDTKCLVLSYEFKLPDENQVLLKVSRENNMYNVNLKNIVPSGDLTCLFAKATLDESNLWRRRLGHINFKTMNKLVKR
nr:ribonuclease H-like domain-containing protein [Tanacetum cinerariifolium]